MSNMSMSACIHLLLDGDYMEDQAIAHEAYLKIRSASPRLAAQFDHLVTALVTCYDEYQDGQDVYEDGLSCSESLGPTRLRARLHLSYLIETLANRGLIKILDEPIINELLKLPASFKTEANESLKGGSSEEESK